jgi:hypothetical protein
MWFWEPDRTDDYDKFKHENTAMLWVGGIVLHYGGTGDGGGEQSVHLVLADELRLPGDQ